MGDWLGTGAVATFLRQYRSFKKARAFAHSLGLKSGAEWRAYCESGKKPNDIPAKPDYGYANAGWAGMGDWLGTGTVAPGLRQYRSFKKARVFARGLGLKTGAEWFNYSKFGRKPADIPTAPNQIYANDGWAGWGDWLGRYVLTPISPFQKGSRVRAWPRFEICNRMERLLSVRQKAR
jgi:hypothetical protein